DFKANGFDEGNMKVFFEIVASFTVLILFVHIYDQIRVRRLMKQRHGETICQFVRSFDYRRVDTKIIRATYEYLSHWNKVKAQPFPVRASDTIDKIYGIAEEDLDDFAKEVANKT